MISDLSRAIADALNDARLTSANATKMRKRLTAVAIDPLLSSMSLTQVQALARRGHGPVLDELIRDMTLAQLKKVSKAWNPHRAIPKEPIMRDLQVEVRELAASKRQPSDPPLPKKSKGTGSRRGRSGQARMVAAE
ncbi:MAG: hypothetical protein HXY28_09195 [Hydrogenophilaceae bacterium]|jgi:hypothetical protein|nr:hypothetical protein [Hydrogenophilaceae bacterium]